MTYKHSHRRTCQWQRRRMMSSPKTCCAALCEASSVYTHARTHTHTHTHTHARAHTHAHTHTHACTHARTHTHIHTHTHRHTHTCTRTRTNTHTHTHTQRWKSCLRNSVQVSWKQIMTLSHEQKHRNSYSSIGEWSCGDMINMDNMFSSPLLFLSFFFLFGESIYRSGPYRHRSSGSLAERREFCRPNFAEMPAGLVQRKNCRCTKRQVHLELYANSTCI